VDGSYTVTTTGISSPSRVNFQGSSIFVDRNIIKFSMFKASPVRVEIFDARGSLLRKEIKPQARPGSYSFNLAEGNGARQLLIVRAAIGLNKVTFRYFPLKNISSALTATSGAISANEALAKITAVKDTLKVSAANYLSKAVPVTSYDTTVDVSLDSAAGGAVTVRLDQTRQVIEGFGINNNWKELGTSGISACFDSGANGLGLSILRVGMNSSGNLWTGPNDVTGARSRGAKIIGSTWTPPAGDKTNGSENDGGHLKTSSYDSWATKIANFSKTYNLYSMSMGNEPDFASCGMNEPCNGNYPTTLYTAEEMIAFLKVLGPKMRSTAPNCKIMAPEASEWLHTWSDTSGCCSVPGNKPSSDPLKCGCFQGKTTPCSCAPGKGYSYGKYLYEDKAAWAFVDILGVHQYDTQRAEPWPAYIPASDRKLVYQTEMSGVKWWPEGTPSTTIENGLAVASWIHDALVVGEANGWCYWWWQAMGETNEGLLQANGTDTKRHYTFGNFSKYVRPGMTRVEVTGEFPKDVLISAYKNSSTVVVVVINKGAAANVPITVGGGTAPASFIPYVTSGTQNENWSAKSAVSVSGGTLTAALVAKSVTTFVGKL
jgi:glucuronoarabinoxylan endo-1,4-beta-xylanase